MEGLNSNFDGMNLIIDFQGCGLKNFEFPDHAIDRHIIYVLKRHYPETVHRIYVTNTSNPIVQGVAQVAKQLLNASTRVKLKILPSDRRLAARELFVHFPKSALPKSVGGVAEYQTPKEYILIQAKKEGIDLEQIRRDRVIASNALMEGDGVLLNGMQYSGMSAMDVINYKVSLSGVLWWLKSTGAQEIQGRKINLLGKLGVGWSKRFVLLRPDVLLVYEKQDSNTPSLIVPLTEVFVKNVKLESQPKGTFAFSMCIPGSPSYIFASTSEQDRARWLQGIEVGKQSCDQRNMEREWAEEEHARMNGDLLGMDDDNNENVIQGGINLTSAFPQFVDTTPSNTVDLLDTKPPSTKDGFDGLVFSQNINPTTVQSSNVHETNKLDVHSANLMNHPMNVDEGNSVEPIKNVLLTNPQSNNWLGTEIFQNTKDVTSEPVAVSSPIQGKGHKSESIDDAFSSLTMWNSGENLSERVPLGNTGHQAINKTQINIADATNLPIIDSSICQTTLQPIQGQMVDPQLMNQMTIQTMNTDQGQSIGLQHVQQIPIQGQMIEQSVTQTSEQSGKFPHSTDPQNVHEQFPTQGQPMNQQMPKNTSSVLLFPAGLSGTPEFGENWSKLQNEYSTSSKNTLDALPSITAIKTKFNCQLVETLYPNDNRNFHEAIFAGRSPTDGQLCLMHCKLETGVAQMTCKSNSPTLIQLVSGTFARMFS